MGPSFHLKLFSRGKWDTKQGRLVTTQTCHQRSVHSESELSANGDLLLDGLQVCLRHTAFGPGSNNAGFLCKEHGDRNGSPK